jgi:hypothetical protein
VTLVASTIGIGHTDGSGEVIRALGLAWVIMLFSTMTIIDRRPSHCDAVPSMTRISVTNVDLVTLCFCGIVEIASLKGSILSHFSTEGEIETSLMPFINGETFQVLARILGSRRLNFPGNLLGSIQNGSDLDKDVTITNTLGQTTTVLGRREKVFGGLFVVTSNTSVSDSSEGTENGEYQVGSELHIYIY